MRRISFSFCSNSALLSSFLEIRLNTTVVGIMIFQNVRFCFDCSQLSYLAIFNHWETIPGDVSFSLINKQFPQINTVKNFLTLDF